MRRAASVAGNVLQAVVVTIAACAVGLVLVAQLRSWQLLTVVSDSMSPTYPARSLLAVERVDVADVSVGDVVVFRPEPSGSLVSHRVVRVDETPAGRELTTQGDANEDPDSTPVTGPSLP
jgi:signal peptidase